MKTPRSLQKLLWTLFAFLLTLSLTTTNASADSMARIVRLSYVDGASVQVDRNDSNGYSQAFANEPIVEGGSLWVGDDSHAEVQFEDGSTMRLGPNSAVNFNELRLDGSGHFSTQLTVQEGVVYFNLQNRNNDRFRVLFAQYQIDVTKAVKFRIDGDQNELHLAVTSGVVDFVNVNGAHMDVRKNETLSFDLTDPTRPYMAREVATLEDDNWNQQRDDTLAQQASAQNYNGYSQNYSYGFNDLNAYGSYYNDPNYGSVWQPYNVGLSWDPFDAGYWVDYPLQGYIWVSAYPWGWAPYRYGSWVFINGRGWCWRHDAHYYQQIAFTPRIINPPPNYRRLIMPTRPGAGVGTRSTGGTVTHGGVIVVNRGPNDRSNPLFRSSGGSTTGNNGNGVTVGNAVVREHTNANGEHVVTNESLRTARSSRESFNSGNAPVTREPVRSPGNERSTNENGLGIARGSRTSQGESPAEQSQGENGRNEEHAQPRNNESGNNSAEASRAERLGREKSQGNGGTLGVGNIPDTRPRPEQPENPDVQREPRVAPTQPIEPRGNNSGGSAPRIAPAEPARAAPAAAPAAVPRGAPVAPPAPRTPPPASHA